MPFQLVRDGEKRYTFDSEFQDKLQNSLRYYHETFEFDTIRPLNEDRGFLAMKIEIDFVNLTAKESYKNGSKNTYRVWNLVCYRDSSIIVPEPYLF